MHNFFSGTKYKITLCILTALFLGVFIAAATDSGYSPFTMVLSRIMSPLENAAEAISSDLKDFRGNFVSSKKYREQIELMQGEIDSYKGQLVDYERIRHKLDAYEEFLGVKDENPDYTFVPASVILKDAGDIYGSFTLNKGTKDGIKKNDPVIFGKALVGTVKSVTENSCTVYTLMHPTVSVSSYEIRTREDCYTTAENTFTSKGYIKLEGLSRSTPAVPGGIICSSGIGGIYPKDLLIGTIKEIVNDGTGISCYALIEPETDYSVLTDVFIITGFSGKAG